MRSWYNQDLATAGKLHPIRRRSTRWRRHIGLQPLLRLLQLRLHLLYAGAGESCFNRPSTALQLTAGTIALIAGHCLGRRSADSLLVLQSLLRSESLASQKNFGMKHLPICVELHIGVSYTGKVLSLFLLALLQCAPLGPRAVVSLATIDLRVRRPFLPSVHFALALAGFLEVHTARNQLWQAQNFMILA